MPDPDPVVREEWILCQARERPAAERSAFLDETCAADVSLRRRVEARLEARDSSGPTVLNSDAQTAGSERSAEERAGAIIGRYRLLEKIGDGGFGAVYAAEQKEPVKRRVALKIIKLGMDTRQVVARFESERQALALMDHPNIAKVLDGGATELGRPYFVMELVRGIPITQHCDQNNLPTQQRLNLFIQVCQAIQHAHQKGIIHRDIKPSNILVSLADGVAVPKVIDFGIAKATLGELTDKTVYTQLQQFIGTPAYMSPEQAEMSAQDIDTRSDIYSLGVLLYELLLGRTPFDTKELLQSGLDQMRRTIREKEPVRPSTRLSNLPDKEQTATARRHAAEPPRLITLLRGDLDWIVMKCLEKDRMRRYETANGLGVDVRRFLNNEPVMARPPTAAYKFQKAWRRNRVVYTAGLAVAIALVLGGLGSLAGLFKATRERANAQAEAQNATRAKAEAQQARALAEAKSSELDTNLYYNRIALAHRELTAQPSNVGLAETLLDDCSDRLRNWEWHHLKRRRFFDPLVLRDPASKEIQSVSFSKDMHHLAAGGGDGIVRIWDLDNLKVAQALDGHTGLVASVVFSPVNPSWIASAGLDKRVLLRDWQTGRILRSWPAAKLGGGGMAYALAFSPDGRRLAAPGQQKDVIVWGTTKGELVWRLPGHEDLAQCVRFSCDGRWIATGSAKGIVRLWDASDGQLVAKIGSFGPPVSGVTFSGDGRFLAASQVDGHLRVWDMQLRRDESYRRVGFGVMAGLAWHPTMQRLVTGDQDRLVILHEPLTGQQILVLRELARTCPCLAFNSDGTRLAAGSGDGTVHIWDATPLRQSYDSCNTTLRYPGHVWGLDIAQNGRLAVAGQPPDESRRAPIIVWQNPDFQKNEALAGHKIIVFSLSYDPTGHVIASCGDDVEGLSARVWDVQSGREAFRLEPFQENLVLFSIAFSPDGRWLAAGGRARNVQVWDGATGRKVGIVGEHSGEIIKVSFSGDGSYLASMDGGDTVKVWDAKRLNQRQGPFRTFHGQCGAFSDMIAFSPDGSRLALVSNDDTVIIHNLRRPEASLPLVSQGHRPIAVAFSPDARWVASGGEDCSVRIWEASTGHLRKTYKSHTD